MPDLTLVSTRPDALLEAIVNTSRDALLVLDGRERPVLWNAALLDMLHIARDRHAEVMPAEISARLSEYVGQRSGGPFHQRPGFVAKGEVTSDVVAAQDGRIFERVERPCTLAEGLGRVVWYRDARGADVADLGADEEREAALAAQLRQAHKMEAIGRLAGGVAHDFNNLLTAITGHADLLGDELGPHPGLQEILSAAGSGARLTRQLLAFSRQQHLSPAVVDVGQIIRGVSGMLRRLIGEHIELAVEIPEKLASIKADPGQLEQILVNLVVNARDAMPNGGRVLVSASVLEWSGGDTRRSAMPMGSYVALRVEDTGSGIDADILPHVFEPFFTTKGTGGTGLGLATVYGIAKQSGGFVWVDSHVGRGTVFSVEFPVTEAVADATAASADATPAATRGLKTILVVEDQDNVRRIVVRFLQSEGHRIIETGSPSDALRLMSEGAAIDLLVTDVVMPVMSGKELSRRLRERWPTLRTVYMSGFSNEHLETVPDALFVPKPFNRSALVNKVREALSWTAPQ